MSSIGVTMKFQKNALAIAVMVATSTLTACSSDTVDEIKEILDRKPTEIKLSGVTVDENAKGAEIATLETVDLDLNESFTYTTDNENFVISGNTLSLAPEFALDYEKDQAVTFNITVTDKDSNQLTQEVTIEVNDLLDYYGFMSKVGDTEKSSVSYGGQTARHALIAELKHYIGKGGLQADVTAMKTTPFDFTTKAGIVAKLNSFYDADTNSWDELNISFTTAKQTAFSELSSSYKSLKEKVAGNDASGQHKLWNGEVVRDENNDPIVDADKKVTYTNTDIAFAGWTTWDEVDEFEGLPGVIPQQTPHGLIQQFFGQLADIALENPGQKRYAPGAAETEDNVIPVYVTDNGTDLNQLIQKFLLMSVAYSQAADDYLDEDKGLATDNIGQDKGTKDYTKLEHQFDEGFGYFGAARDYLAYSDYEIAGKVKDDESNGRLAWNGQHDTDGDGVIDLMSEKNFGNSVNAAKRDVGSEFLADDETPNPAATDYTKAAMDAFLMGRKVINDNAGMDLSADQRTELLTYRDAALDAWERGVVATVIHYINDLDADLAKIGTDEFDYEKAAKHFSELKGFALGLQFNPYSPIAGLDDAKFAKFTELHGYIKDAPVLVGEAAIADYRADLAKARQLLQDAYEFDAATVANW